MEVTGTRCDAGGMSDDATLVAEGIRVRQGHRDLLPPTSARVEVGQVTIAVGTEVHSLTALALALAGRLPLSAGTVRLGGDPGAAALREAVALVDVPGVSAPEPGVPVRTVVAEELAFARRRTGFRVAQRWLDEHDLGTHARDRIEDLDPDARLTVLTELARHRAGVSHLVLGLPERHGGPAEEWLARAEALAGDGFGVLVTVTRAVANEHDATCLVGGAVEPGAVA